MTFKLAQKAYKRAARIPLASLNYYLGNYENPIWVTGDGRSGTTWLLDLINWHGKYRVLFEPFHPQFVKALQGYEFFQYLRVEERDSDLEVFLRSVFSGKFKNVRSDTSQIRLFYEGLLVKDIFSNLMLPWVNHNLPSVKKVLVIRNPFASALSKQKKKGWTWMTDPKDFLKQKELYVDHLTPFEEIISTVGDDFIERQVLIWAIVHYVPFKYLSQKDICILFYEKLAIDTEQQLKMLFRFLTDKSSDDEIFLNGKILEKISKPSRTSGKASGSNLMRGQDPVKSWLNELSTQQIDRGMEILHTFGLSDIYGTNALPNKDVLQSTGLMI